MPSSVTEDQLRRVCRMYPTNTAAAKALGYSRQYFLELCKKYGVKRPVEGHFRGHSRDE